MLRGFHKRALDWSFYNEASSKLGEKDHGVLGALILAHLLAIREGFVTTQRRNFLHNHLPACHAIGVHHLTSVPIEFSKHPFAFLLILCDELQDWGRPSDQTNQDMIHLNDINIRVSNRPEIQILTEISEERKKRLEEALSGRLYTCEKIDLVIMNPQKKTVFHALAFKRALIYAFLNTYIAQPSVSLAQRR